MVPCFHTVFHPSDWKRKEGRSKGAEREGGDHDQLPAGWVGGWVGMDQWVRGSHFQCFISTQMCSAPSQVWHNSENACKHPQQPPSSDSKIQRKRSLPQEGRKEGRGVGKEGEKKEKLINSDLEWKSNVQNRGYLEGMRL